MIPDIIEYILSQKYHGETPGVFNRVYQILIPNFPPRRTINYTIRPSGNIHAYILYEWTFGQAMVPHSFDTKVDQGGNRLFDVVLSGRFTTDSAYTLAVLTYAQPMDITVTNLRLLTNYYESTTFYVAIQSKESYDVIIDALRRMNTSTYSESLLSQSKDLLTSLVRLQGGSEYPPHDGGR